MKAVLLAGGFGNRLKPLTYNRPKPMIPLLNKPVIEYIIEYLRDYSVDEILITTNYMREQVISCLGDGKRYGVKISYPKESVPLGTAGSVKNIEDQLDDTFMVIQGDNITDLNLGELVRAHKKHGGFATIALHEVSDPSHYGVVEIKDDGRVTGFWEKPRHEEAKSNLINTGLYVIEPDVFDLIPENRKYDFSRDLFPILVERERLYAKDLPGFWADVGNPEGYLKAKEWLISRIRNHIPQNTVVGGTLTNPVFFGENVSIGRGASIIGPTVIGDNTLIEDDCSIGPGTVLGPNVTIKSGSNIHEAVVFEKTVVGRNGRLEGCLLAEENRVGGNTVVNSNSIIGAGCKLGWYVIVHENSRIWPNMSVAHGSTVSGTLRQFVQVDEGVDNPYWHLRTVSDDEAFYFNTSVDGRIVHTGLKARSLPEFREHLHEVDLECIKHHLRYDVNDFRDWADRIIRDRKLAIEYTNVKNNNSWWADNTIQQRIIQATEKRLQHLYELVYY